METDSVRFKKIVLLAGALSAYWIGSGFTTGQEVLQFFAVNGINGFIGALIFLVIMSLLAYALYGIGQKEQFENPYDVFEYYCGKMVGQVYVWYCVILVYAVFVVMLAGGGATINQYYGIPTHIGTGAIALLALGTAVLGIEKLIGIIGVIGPIKIVFVSVVGIAGIVTLSGQPALLIASSNLMPTLGFKAASSNWAWSGALYAFLVLMISIPFMVDCGASLKNPKEARIAGVVGTFAFTVAIFALITGEMVYYSLIVDKQVPTLAIANHISPALGFVFSILIVVSIYSAVASFLLMTVRKFAPDKTRKFNVIATVLTVLGIIFGSFFPFDKLVNILYPLAGYSAIAFACFMVRKEVFGQAG